MPPRSATAFPLTLLALSVGLALVWLIDPARGVGMPAWLGYAPIVPCLGIVAVIGVGEWLRARALGAARARPLAHPRAHPLPRPGEGQPGAGHTSAGQRTAVRLLGFAATLAAVALVYWLLPEYHGTFYAPFWRLLRTVAPVGCLVPFYFLWMDRRLPDLQHDEYYQFGWWLLGHRPRGTWPTLRRHLGGWAVKAFFLPLMTVYLANEVQALASALDAVAPTTMALYQVFYHLSYTVDLLFCVVGYSVAIRLFDSQIRSVEPTVAGWLVALLCYQPFYSVVGRFYLQYDDATYWDNWLAAWPTVRTLWAIAIIALALIYALCTTAFGLRFSNLTHRGIITGGPYRFTKHPAYIAKNLSWWLISVPFVSELGWEAALRNCCLLALLNGVYLLRARTEERHLSADPVYVEYARWIDQHGLFRIIGRGVPLLRYRPPV